MCNYNLQGKCFPFDSSAFSKYFVNTTVFLNTMVLITLSCLVSTKNSNINTTVFLKMQYFLCPIKRTLDLFFESRADEKTNTFLRPRSFPGHRRSLVAGDRLSLRLPWIDKETTMEKTATMVGYHLFPSLLKEARGMKPAGLAGRGRQLLPPHEDCNHRTLLLLFVRLLRCRSAGSRSSHLAVTERKELMTSAVYRVPHFLKAAGRALGVAVDFVHVGGLFAWLLGLQRLGKIVQSIPNTSKYCSMSKLWYLLPTY